MRRSSRTKGGRGSDRAKVAWLHTLDCLVQVRRRAGTYHDLEPEVHGYASAAQLLPSPCGGVLEVHHDRLRGSPANDRKTVPVCSAHHRTGPHSLAQLGRRGFQEFHGIDMDRETTWYELEWQTHKAGAAF